jgi:hypothetical protein
MDADLELVRSLYSTMPDEKLIFFAIHEKHDMTPEAVQIIEEELQKRGLDIEAISASGQTIQHQNKKWEQLTKAIKEDGIESAWQLVLDEKTNGTPDADIIEMLQRKGFSPDVAAMFLYEAPAECRRRLDKYNGYILSGGAALIAGIAGNVIAKNYGFIVFIGWGLILGGFIGLVMGLSRGSKYKSLLKLLQKDT